MNYIKESLDERSENREWKIWLKTHSKSKDHGIQSHHFMVNRWGNNGNSDRLYFLGLQKSLQMVTTASKLKKMLAPWKKSCDQSRQHIKKQRHYFTNKGLYSQRYSVSSSHVRMWELDLKEGWVPKNSCFWIVVLEKTLESPLYCTEIKQVNPKGNQPWIFTGRTVAKAEAPILWLPEAKSIGKDPDAGKNWRQ